REKNQTKDNYRSQPYLYNTTKYNSYGSAQPLSIKQRRTPTTISNTQRTKYGS
ncbi:14026_t:CDS:1, partial [Gigaspora margarita]